MMGQHLYRVPYRLHRRTAKTKAEIHYLSNLDGSDPRPAPGAPVVEILAATHAEAGRKLQDAILPGDSRPVRGRTAVKWFVVRTPVSGWRPSERS